MTLAAPAVVVDRTSPVPLYFQVAQQLERLIESGEMLPGTRLENEVALADQLGLSRPTMRQAIQYLVERGLVARRRGVGTVVQRPRVRRPAQLTSLFDDLEKSGQRPRTSVLRFSREPADDAVASALEVPLGTEVHVLERLRYAGDEPLALMHNYVPAALLPLTEEVLRSRGLYDLLRAAGITPHSAAQTVGARAASPAEARALGERRGAPLLTMERTAYDGSGRVIEHGSHVYRASRYSFTMTLSRA